MVVLLVLPLKKQTTNCDLYVTAVLGMSKEGEKNCFGRAFFHFSNESKEQDLSVCLVGVGLFFKK